MQKILRINLNARNQGVRAARRNNLKKIKSEWFDYEQQFVQGQRTRTKAIKEERANRREDWIAGPLAPKRDVGRLKGLYGTIETAASRSPVVPRNARLGEDDTSKDPDDEEGEDPHEIPESKVIEGNARNIIAGDRVCVIRGREGTKGRIGKVKEIFLDRNEISVEGINMVCSILRCDRPISISFPNMTNLLIYHLTAPNRPTSKYHRPPPKLKQPLSHRLKFLSRSRTSVWYSDTPSSTIAPAASSKIGTSSSITFAAGHLS